MFTCFECQPNPNMISVILHGLNWHFCLKLFSLLKWMLTIDYVKHVLQDIQYTSVHKQYYFKTINTFTLVRRWSFLKLGFFLYVIYFHGPHRLNLHFSLLNILLIGIPNPRFITQLHHEKVQEWMKKLIFMIILYLKVSTFIAPVILYPLQHSLNKIPLC